MGYYHRIGFTDFQQTFCRPLVEPFDPELVNPASLDIRIGETAKWRHPMGHSGYVDVDLTDYGRDMPDLFQPGALYLVASLETINLPSFVTAQFKLKSSRGREWYGHQLAGFCDPGWHGSKLTMELTNDDIYDLPLYPGMKIGQLVFDLTLGIPDADYSKTGRYNGDRQVMGSRG
jgi:dCTP deaminase